MMRAMLAEIIDGKQESDKADQTRDDNPDQANRVGGKELGLLDHIRNRAARNRERPAEGKGHAEDQGTKPGEARQEAEHQEAEPRST